MCRIAGIASPSAPLSELQSSVAAMCAALQHGGPDGEGLYANEECNLVFGHRRLALIDLSPSGHQPMHYAEGRLTITFNGEIYNYPELKTELQALGFRFQTNSDTEVILAAFAAWGTASFARLNGMFAFALFDSRTADVYLVRDVIGIKPLYYYCAERTLIFASEVRTFQYANQSFKEHPHWPVHLMAYGHLPEPVTTLKEVVPLQKGTFLKFNARSGKRHLAYFDHLRLMEKEAVREEIIRNIKASLKAAVKRHLLSDAPIGVFLSGGIDSSIIALLAGEMEKENLNTLSIYFKEKTYSEKKYQDLVLQKLSSHHRQHQLSVDEFHYHLPEIIASMDLPSSDGINTWFISKNASEAGLKAVLSGLGGDELFGGYPSFRRMALTTALQKLPKSTLKSGRYTRSKKFRRLTYLSLEGIKGQYLFLRGQFIPAAISRYLGMDESEVWQILEEAPVLSDVHHLSPGNRASWMELNLYMQNQLLRDSDVMSMAHGLEIRVPFLDKAFVKLALSIASKEKYSGQLGKQLLIDSFTDLLPAEVWNRKKMGFSFPFDQWLKEDEWARSKMMSGGAASINTLKLFDQGQIHWSGLLTTLLLRTHRHETQPAFFNA